MEIRILFGTESGGGEITADEIAEAIEDRHQVTVENMSDVDVTTMTSDALYLVICSSYGEGELPYSAKPFYDALIQARPELSGCHYAMFGRGDTSYLKTYMGGSKVIDSLLTELGARRVGTFAELDASEWDIDFDFPINWAEKAIAEYSDAQKNAEAAK